MKLNNKLKAILICYIIPLLLVIGLLFLYGYDQDKSRIIDTIYKQQLAQEIIIMEMVKTQSNHAEFIRALLKNQEVIVGVLGDPMYFKETIEEMEEDQ